MVNEFSYCPRLFFEWVQAGVFAEKAGQTVRDGGSTEWSIRRAVGHHSPAQVS